MRVKRGAKASRDTPERGKKFVLEGPPTSVIYREYREEERWGVMYLTLDISRVLRLIA